MHNDTCEYIGTIVSDRRRKEQEEIIYRLFNDATTKGLSVIAIFIRPTIFLYHKLKKLSFYHKNGIFMLSCKNKSDIDEAFKLIKKIHPWQISSIQFLIGIVNLDKEIQQELSKSGLSMVDLQTKTLLKKLDQHIISVLDPLDNDINVYGKPDSKSLMQQYIKSE